MKLLLALVALLLLITGCYNLNGTNDYQPSHGIVNTNDFSPVLMSTNSPPRHSN